jgi:hypothetical protein
MDARLKLAAAIIAGGLLTGCARERDRVRGLLPAPLAAVRKPIPAASERPLTPEDFHFREREFVNHTPRLNVAGEDHVRQIAAALPSTRFKVMIEPSAVEEDPEAPQVDQQRRNLIVQSLLALGITDAESRVVVGTPAAELAQPNPDRKTRSPHDMQNIVSRAALDSTPGSVVVTDGEAP